MSLLRRSLLALALAFGASAFTVDSYLGACSSASRGMPFALQATRSTRSYAPGSWAPPSPAPTTILEPPRAAASAVEEVIDEEVVSEPVVTAEEEEEDEGVAEGFAKPDIWIKEDFSEFSMWPEELLSKAKEFLSEPGFVEQGKWMSDTDFTFLGPVVGPLNKEAYLRAIGGFDVFSIFPDLNPNYYGLTVDPMEEGRVWAISRMTATNKETGEVIESPPQAISVTFDKETFVTEQEWKVTKFTIGAVIDRSVGNTGGLGGLFGPLYAIGQGLPFPEAQPWKPSKRYRAFMFVGNLAAKVAAKFSKKE